jgi:hypothetical protein
MEYQNKIQNYIYLINILYETEVLHGTNKPRELLCSKDHGQVLKFLNLKESVSHNISNDVGLKFAKLSENPCLQ